MTTAQLSSAHDKLLFTPGPLTTSLEVKQAMLHDAGSWHFEFNARVSAIRDRLLGLAGVSRANGWETVLLQGSGTYGVEAVFQTCVPPHGKVLALSNGAYGERIVRMLEHARIAHTVLRTPEDTPANPDTLDAQLRDDPAITHVAVVHCETTTGILNPLPEIGAVTRRHQRSLVVDAMSSFGAYPVDLEGTGVDYLISSANKCLEGVPGFAFVICPRRKLEACAGFARSLSLDLLGQLKGFDANDQFRFTPPTHSLLAFEQALRELELEGGFTARLARYQLNHRILVDGMRAMGFRPYLDPAVQSCIITAFLYRNFPGFDFLTLYRRLSDSGFIIYPGKLTQTDTFRIGSIGRLFPADMRALLHAIDQATLEWRPATTAAPAA